MKVIKEFDLFSSFTSFILLLRLFYLSLYIYLLIRLCLFALIYFLGEDFFVLSEFDLAFFYFNTDFFIMFCFRHTTTL